MEEQNIKRHLSHLHRLEVVLHGDPEESDGDVVVACTQCGEVVSTLYDSYAESRNYRVRGLLRMETDFTVDSVYAAQDANEALALAVENVDSRRISNSTQYWVSGPEIEEE